MKKVTLLIVLVAMFFQLFAIEVNYVKQFEGTSRAVAFYGNYAYVSTGFKINILDVSKAENIHIVNSIMVVSNDYINTMVVDMGKKVLIVGMDFTTKVYSIANPVFPALLTTLQQECDKVIINGNNLILGTDHIYFYDFSDATNPVYLSNILIDYSSGGFCTKDDYLYSFTQFGYSGSHSVISYDISNPENPQYITYLEIGYYSAPWPEEMDVKDDFIFMALADSLKIFEIQGGGTVTYNSWFVLPDKIHSFHIEGDYLYAGLESGLKIYDISDIYNIQEVGGYDYETYIRDIDVSDGLTFIAGNTNGYKILKTNDPLNIEEKYFSPYTDIPYGICFNGNVAFFSLYSRGLQAVYLEDPLNPVNLGNYETENLRVLKYKDHAVFGMKNTGSDSLLIFDVSDVFQISLAATITSSTGISDFVFSGDYLLINEYNLGIKVFDISNPLNPEEVGSQALNSGSKLAVDNNILFIGGQYGMTDTARIKIAAYDISLLPQITFLNDYFFDDPQKYHIQKIIPDLPNLYLGVWKGIVSMEYDDSFTVKDELLYFDPDYIHCYNFLKDNDYIFFNALSNISDTKAVKIINGNQLQEDELNVNFVPSAKYDSYFYSLKYKGGYSIYKQGDLVFDPPQNFTAAIMGDCTLELSWDPPQSGTPSYYLIYQNGEQIDSITGTSYTLELYFSSYNEFYVVAGYIDPNGLSIPSNTVYVGIPGGYEVPYWEDFEYNCINWFSTPIVGNDDFYHCDTVSYEGDYSLAWYSETQGAETKCGPQYITPVICPDIFVRFYYKTPEKNGSYDKLYLYLNDVEIAGPLPMANEWTNFYTILEDVWEDFNLDFKAVGDNGGGIFIDNYKVDIEIGIDNNSVTDNMVIYPNPVANSLNLQLKGKANQSYLFEILTTEGRVVKHFDKIFLNSNKQTISFDTGDLKSGIYFLKIISGEGVAVRKFVVKCL